MDRRRFIELVAGADVAWAAEVLPHISPTEQVPPEYLS